MWKRIYKSGFYFIVLFLVITGFSAGVEHITLQTRISKFKKSAVLVEEYKYAKYYEVPRKSYMRDMPVFSRDHEAGYNGDIFATTDSPLYIPIVDSLVGTLFGGHAAIITDGGKFQIESQGDDPLGENNVKKIPNSWAGYNGITIGLRMKNATEEDYKKAVENAEDVLAKKAKYNYKFVISNGNSFYCTDLMSYVWQSVNSNYNLNNDRFVTTTYDLLTSNMTYITYYHYFDQKGVQHIYYTA